MIKRELYMKRIRPFFGKDLVKVLTGVRRCGKSILLTLIKEELIEAGINPSNIIYIDLEEKTNSHLRLSDALYDEVIKRSELIEGKVYLFFDEIQEVIKWEECIRYLRKNDRFDVYITGSNATLLSGELSTYLAGRYVQFVIYPFSFAEFTNLYHTINPEATTVQCFQKYIHFGGMPYLANLRYEETPSREYLSDLFNAVHVRDIVLRNNVRDIDLLDRILSYMVANAGTPFSIGSIVKFLKSEFRIVAPETIMNYIKYSTNAFILFKAKRNDLIGKHILSTSEKYYIVDHGIREAIFSNNIEQINLTLENIIFMELKRRGYKIEVGKVGNKEIDFVATNAGKKIYIQVCYILATEETREREFGVYKDVDDNFPKYVVSMDEFDMSRNGIKHFNIRDFLLKEDWD